MAYYHFDFRDVKKQDRYQQNRIPVIKSSPGYFEQTRPDGLADLKTLQLGGPPILGSSRQVEASRIERGPVATFASGTIPLAEMSQSPPRGWTSHSSSDHWVTIDDSTGSVESDTAHLGVAPVPGSSRQVEASPPSRL
jgi:hypothetical protein